MHHILMENEVGFMLTHLAVVLPLPEDPYQVL